MASDGFRLASPATHHEGRLPRKFTDEGQGAIKNVSPPLEWYNLPDGTESLALVVQDIDAPDPSSPIVPRTCWVVANIPPNVKGLPEGFSGKGGDAAGNEYAGIQEGHNDNKVPGWRATKMPSHGHRFEFRLYALVSMLQLGNKVTKEKLQEAVACSWGGHPDRHRSIKRDAKLSFRLQLRCFLGRFFGQDRRCVRQ